MDDMFTLNTSDQNWESFHQKIDTEWSRKSKKDNGSDDDNGDDHHHHNHRIHYNSFASDCDGDDDDNEDTDDEMMMMMNHHHHQLQDYESESKSDEPETEPIMEDSLKQLILRITTGCGSGGNGSGNAGSGQPKSSSSTKIIQPNIYRQSMLDVVKNLRILETNDNIVSLQTIIRQRNCTREMFIFHADRLIRLVIEAGLNLLPYNVKSIQTPTDAKYRGVSFQLHSNCGVSIVRSGEAMERALRDCCRAIRIGKMVITADDDIGDGTNNHNNNNSCGRARVVWYKLPEDISLRKVLLLYPILTTGATVSAAVRLLLKQGVKQSSIILINLFATPIAVGRVASRFPQLTIMTTEVHPVAPHHFGQKYFGTD